MDLAEQPSLHLPTHGQREDETKGSHGPPQQHGLRRRVLKMLVLYQKHLDEYPILTKAVTRWVSVLQTMCNCIHP